MTIEEINRKILDQLAETAKEFYEKGYNDALAKKDEEIEELRKKAEAYDSLRELSNTFNNKQDE